MKIDHRPAKGAWAPGSYLRNCTKCLEVFQGDKLAMWCADCAYSPEQAQQDAIGAFADTGDTKPLVALLDDDAFWADHEARMKELEAQEAKERAAKAADLRRRRLALIPKIYLETFDPKKSKMDRGIVAATREWSPNNPDRLGMGLIGTTGLGKTRLLVRILMRLECTWIYLPAALLAKSIRDQWSDDFKTGSRATEIIDGAHTASVLLLDDIGQENATESVSEAMFELIEDRTSRGRPILWTCNLSGDELAAKHKTRGNALVRRLREFSIMPGEQE